MISRDVDFIAEAYLSALQKYKNYPNDPAMNSIARVNPEVTDRENAEAAEQPEQSVVAVQAHVTQVPAQSEESDENQMTLSNLFSLFTNAKKIHNASVMGLNLEPQAQLKIAVACQGLEDVMKSVAYECASKGIQL